MGSLFIIRGKDGTELGDLLWKYEGARVFIRVRFQCQHQAELAGVSWLVELEARSNDYLDDLSPEELQLLLKSRRFNKRVVGLNCEATWVWEHELQTIKELVASFAHSVYYYRTHEQETLANARARNAIL